MPLLLRNAAVTALLGFAAYSLAGFVVVPHLAVRWIEETAHDGHGLRARIGDAAFNPFTLAVSLYDITVSGHESPPLVSVARVSGVLDAGSFFRSRRAFAGVVTLEELVVGNAGGEPVLQVPTGFASGVSAVPGQSGLQVETLRLPASTLRLRRGQNGAWAPPGWLTALARNGSPVRDIQIADGRLVLVDSATGASSGASEIVLTASLAMNPEGEVRADFAATAGQARARLAARYDAVESGFPHSVELDVEGVPATALAPYAAGAVALEPRDGTVSLSVSANRLADAADIVSRLALRNLQWERAPGEAHGGQEGAQQGGQLPAPQAAMALALLEDDTGLAVIEGRYLAPLSGSDETLAGLLPRLVADSLRLAAGQPFGELAKLAGWGGGDLGRVGFAPGSAQMDAAGIDGVRALARAMLQRPHVGIVVWAGYDSDVDRLALARQQMAQHIALATSTRTAGGSHTTTDTDDPRVRAVLDEFAENRLTTVQHAMIVGQFHATRQDYYAALLEALADNESVKPSAIRRLARYRARAIVRELKDLGIDEARLKIAPGSEQLNAADSAVALRLEPWPAGFSEGLLSEPAASESDSTAPGRPAR